MRNHRRGVANTRATNGSQREHFFALSLDMLCIAGFDGYFTQLNPAWEKTLGFTIEELKSKPFIEFVHPDDRDATIAEAQRLMAGIDTVSFENRYLSKDGSYRWFLWSATTSPKEHLYYAVARDITDRKRAEAALRESEQQTRRIVDSAHDAYVGMDADGLIIAWNPQAERTFGWAREEAIGGDAGRRACAAVDDDVADGSCRADLSTRWGRGLALALGV